MKNVLFVRKKKHNLYNFVLYKAITYNYIHVRCLHATINSIDVDATLLRDYIE